MSGTVGLKGTLGQDMTPVFSALTGKGDVQTERLVIDGVVEGWKAAGMAPGLQTGR